MADLVATSRQGETVEAVVWRVTGSGASALAAVLAANPGLAELGAILPAGTAVTIPASAAAPAAAPLVQLWD